MDLLLQMVVISSDDVQKWKHLSKLSNEHLNIRICMHYIL